MFEMSMPTREQLAALDDTALIELVSAGTRAEAAVAAARLAAIAELVERHCGDEDDQDDTAAPRAFWACDDWDHVAAEVGAAMGITHRRASGQMHIGRNLRRRLPRVGELLASGAINYRVASAISWRTSLIASAEALGAVDADLAAAATRFGVLSDTGLNLAIDACVLRRDPDAGWRHHLAAADRKVRFRNTDDDCGTATVWARLLATDAALLERRLNAMITTVCDDDPRTVAQRRADALGALAAGDTQLACTCSTPDCPGRTDGRDARAEAIHIHVLTDPTTVDAAAETTAAQPAPAQPAEPTEPAAAPPAEPASASPADSFATPPATAAPPKECAAPPSPVLLGQGAIPAPLLAELLRLGVKAIPLRAPGCQPKQGYRPSAALAAYIRMRDLTCRFPGCGVSADMSRPADANPTTHPRTRPRPPHQGRAKTQPRHTNCQQHTGCRNRWSAASIASELHHEFSPLHRIDLGPQQPTAPSPRCGPPCRR